MTYKPLSAPRLSPPWHTSNPHRPHCYRSLRLRRNHRRHLQVATTPMRMARMDHQPRRLHRVQINRSQPRILQRPRQPSNASQWVGKDEIPPCLPLSVCGLRHPREVEVLLHPLHLHATWEEIGLRLVEDVLPSASENVRGSGKGKESARRSGTRPSR
jgi:hypothetical protein